MQSNNFTTRSGRPASGAERAVTHLGHERGNRRTDQPRSPVVLFGDALSGQPSARRRHVPQLQRRRRQRVDLRAGREPPGKGRQQLEERERAADLAGQPRNKFNFYWDEQRNCTLCKTEARRPDRRRRGNNQSPRVQQATWTSPATSRLLYEAGFGTNLILDYGPKPNLPNSNADDSGHRAVFGRVPEQRRHPEPELPRQQLAHRRQQCTTGAPPRPTSPAATACQGRLSRAVHRQQVSTRARTTSGSAIVNNGVPNQLTMTAGPAEVHTHVSTGSFYVQDSGRADD